MQVVNTWVSWKKSGTLSLEVFQAALIFRTVASI